MASLMGAYNSGKRVLTAAYGSNSKRLAGAAATSTSTIFTGSGVLGGDGAGNMQAISQMKNEEAKTKSDFNSRIESLKAEFDSKLSDTSSQFQSSLNSGSVVSTTTIGSG